MEEVFPTYDLSGNRVTTVNTHYRMLTESCTAEFAVPDCEGSCDGCSWTEKMMCKARRLKCKANREGITFPFLEDLSGSMLGLFMGEDFEIVAFHPPPMEFLFEMELQILIFAPPLVYLKLGFSASATLEYALVLDTKGIISRLKFDCSCCLFLLCSS